MSSQIKPPTIERGSVLPIHKQIEVWLREQISSGVLAPGDSLPARKELTELLGGINHLTVRQAIRTLTEEGLLYSMQGRGTFVKERQVNQIRVGLVLPNIDDETPREIARGVQEFFGEVSLENGSPDGLGLVLFDSRHSEEKERQNLAHLQDMPLDGAIIFPVFDGDTAERLVRLKVGEFPTVLVDCAFPGIDFDSVVVDNYSGTHEITTHLLNRGRRRIAWIGRRKGYSSAGERYEGYRDAIADFGLPLDRSLTLEIPTSSPMEPYQETVAKIVKSLVEDADRRPDAIVCNNDLIAFSCLETLTQLGLTVPKEIALVGFDDLEQAQRTSPTLTTIRQPKFEMGREAARLILKRIEDASTEPERIKLPVTMVVRNSS